MCLSSACAQSDRSVEFPRQQVHESHVQHDARQPPNPLASPQIHWPAEIDVTFGCRVSGVVWMGEVSEGESEDILNLE